VDSTRWFIEQLERLDVRRGYVPGNVRVTSLRANLLRKDAEDYELLALARYYFHALYDDFDLHAESIEAGNRYGVLGDDLDEK
jgi:hypothetical protein